MAQSENIAALAAALCEAQFEMEGAKKDSVNPHFKSRYADLTSVWNACRAALHANGLSVVQAPEPCEIGIQLRTILLHKSGEWIDSVIVVPAIKIDAQAFGSAMSYARRYALAAMVGVAPDDDDDNAASAQPQRPQPAQRAEYVPAPADDTAEMKAKFVAKFGPWSQHFSPPEPRDRQGWINAGKELAARIEQATKQAPLSDEYAEIDAAIPNGAAGVKR